ncbi:hypothetical protein BGX27_001345 [Mortierella sp. AM989]|nr:hypothetical protein BGX27_001345 [Mortierella sp. AM989]
MSADIVQHTVGLLENSHTNISSDNNKGPFQGHTPTESLEESSDRVTASDTRIRSRREIVAFDGFMFDSSVLRDHDEQDTRDIGQISSENTISLDAHVQLDQQEDNTVNDTTGPKKKTLSTSSISSTSSVLSSSSTSSSSSSAPPLVPPSETLVEIRSDYQDCVPVPESADEIVSSTLFMQFQKVEGDPRLEASSVTSSNESVTKTESQEDIKEVQIETEDPSHLFWVPFHLHPEIAPNEYNRWLTKHGVDSSGSGSILAARKESLNRRKSVLSTQYNPDDEEDDEDSGHAGEQKPKPVAEQDDDKSQQDFLSGVFSVPLEQMGEPPLKTKSSLRRASSHAELSHSQSHCDPDTSEDKAAEDLVAVKRGSGLTRHGPSLLRRSARMKIRRDSNTSSEIKNDISRLRPALVENGEYPAVTLVDPGPIPLPSTSSTTSLLETETTEKDTPETDTPVLTEPVQQPLKRFVSTLRDSSKPTITTYIEPQLLEQCQKEIEASSRSLKTLTTLAIADASNADPKSLISSKEPSASVSYESVITSKVTFPIPPPVKLNQNLLQQPAQQPPATSARPSSSGPLPTKHQTIVENQLNSSGGPPSLPNSKKSSSWSWLWGKEKAGDKATEATQRPQQKPSTVNPQQHPKNNAVQIETVAKKQSTLSSLFSRNGKGSSKPQTGSAGSVPSVQNKSPGQTSARDPLNDPSRMPIHIERAIYRMSHVKLANVRRPLHEQVLISNMMFWYLGVIQQQQLEQQNTDMQQQQSQQSQQSQVVHSEQGTEQVKLDGKESIQAISVKQKALKKKKSQQDGLISESKVEGSEYIVPQQDSNSHARSPCKDVQGIAHSQSLHKPPSTDYLEYDEESMIGGGFGEDFDWYDEREDEQEIFVEDGAGSLYLQEGAQVTVSSGQDSAAVHSRRAGAISS